MLEEGSVWFLVADGRRARVLIEQRRGAVLVEPPDWNMEISAEELYEPQDKPTRVHERATGLRHSVDMGRNLHEEEEAKFLRRVATRIADAEKQGGFEHLAVAAPPRALGLLRTLLPESVLQRLRADLAKDLLDEDATTLRTRLQELLRR